MIALILIFLCLLLLLLICHNKTRFYLYSFFLPWLFDHPRISKFLGIRYEDETWKTNRIKSRIYVPGLFAQFIRWFIGTDFIMTHDVRKMFERLQAEHAEKINMEPYFNELNGKTISVTDFENFLSRNVIVETNRVFKILTDEDCKFLVLYSHVLRTVVSALTINFWNGVKMAATNFHHLIKMSKLLKSAPEHTRSLLIAPQLALIPNFVKMIINKKGDMSDLQPFHFLEPVSRFFVAITTNDEGKDQLVFVNKVFDQRNSTNNRAFGPSGFQCPGAIYTFKFIKDVTKFLKILDIQIIGEPIYKGNRFSSIVNKDDIKMTFKWSSQDVTDVN